jgi:Uma2 family endonuclease
MGGIAEYWVLDLNGRRLIVHREPAADGYRTITAYGEDERVATLASPLRDVRAGELFLAGDQILALDKPTPVGPRGDVFEPDVVRQRSEQGNPTSQEDRYPRDDQALNQTAAKKPCTVTPPSM